MRKSMSSSGMFSSAENMNNNDPKAQSLEEQNNPQSEAEQLKMSPEHLLYSGLSLLGYNFAEESKILNVKIGIGAFDQPNPKAFYNILKFLLTQIASSTECIDMLLYYPPRNPKDTLHFKQEAYKILTSLQKKHLVSSSLFLSKMVLDEVGGIRCVQFLRFLSEFVLRFIFQQRFPAKPMKSFNLNSRIERKTDHQLHLIDELYPSLSILTAQKEQEFAEEELELTTDSIKAHLEIEYDTIEKRMNAYTHYSAEVHSLAEGLNRNYQEQRAVNIRLREFLQNEHRVPEKLLTDLRKLDRMPQIDLIKQTLSELSEIDSRIKESNFNTIFPTFHEEFFTSNEANIIDRKLMHIIDDVDKEGKQEQQPIIKVEQFYKAFQENLKVTERKIANAQTEEFLTYQTKLLDKLAGVSKQASTLTAQLNNLKSACQDEL